MRFLIFFVIFSLSDSFLNNNFNNFFCNLNHNNCKEIQKKLFSETSTNVEKTLYNNARKIKIKSLNIKKFCKQNKLLDSSLDFSSQNVSEDMVEELKQSFSDIIEINKEYIFLITVIINEMIKFSIKKTFNDDEIKKQFNKTLIRIIFKNVIIPVAIHDIFQILFDFIKHK